MYETRADYPTTAMEAQAVRVVESTEECLRCEKTLNHLAGRVVELRECLSGVLTPSLPHAESNSKPELKASSALTEKFRTFNRIVSGTISDIEDILNRLDV